MAEEGRSGIPSRGENGHIRWALRKKCARASDCRQLVAAEGESDDFGRSSERLSDFHRFRRLQIRLLEESRPEVGPLGGRGVIFRVLVHVVGNAPIKHVESIGHHA
jgi:hypothetical protein